MRHRAPLLLVALATLAGTRSASGDGSPAAPDAVLKSLEKTTLDLARKGRSEDVEDLLESLARLGRPAADVTKLRVSAQKLVDAAGKVVPAPELAASLKAQASALLPLLASAQGADRLRIAQAVALLDNSLAPAEEALGRVLVEGRWAPKDTPAILKRRAEIAEAVRAARRLEVPITHGESDLTLFQDLSGKPGSFAQWDGFSVHSVRLSPERLERIVRESVRAVALSNYFRTGTLALPASIHPLRIAALGSDEDYRKAIDLAVAQSGLKAADRDWYRQLASFQDARGHIVSNATIETYEEATYVYWLFRRQSTVLAKAQGQPCLDAGHLNWVCLSYLGTTVPNAAIMGVKETVKSESDTVGRSRSVERQEFRRLAEAGIAGTHAWMRWLAAHHEDPPWTAAMQKVFGEITGEPLLKATVVAEYLQETGEFGPLWTETVPANADASLAIPQVIAKGLGQELASFETRWREWLLPSPDGVVQRLLAPPPPPVDPVVKRMLGHLDAIRKAAFEKRALGLFRPMQVEPSLSRGCVLHARYLNRHPEQTAKWPDAHEEYPDRKEFTPEGCFAGLHSVIAPGVDGPEAALNAWMGTFYHRLPLLAPGLQRVGWGLESRIAVLDAGSMVAPSVVLAVLWPHEGAKDVPTRFVPEIPNPVPGEDQAKWGHPVTVQLFEFQTDTRLALHLYEGSPGAAREVACHVSTPEKPSNPELALPGTWCLIPKAPLAPRSQFTVTVAGLAAGTVNQWTFTTGSK